MPRRYWLAMGDLGPLAVRSGRPAGPNGPQARDLGPMRPPGGAADHDSRWIR